ncbi:hypothetical protein R4Z09_26215 [Niallia oryzisoli]|uniref:Uncharacterized protein n=1 Tax=Niallia oryzisoli TaxID=1737571 RepID=A0ABZ2CB35_9BACI
MKLDKESKWKIIVWILIAPIVVNILMFLPSFGTSFGEPLDWLGFFGNYSGGIIGGIVAYIIASGQIKVQNKENEKNNIESSRSYIILEEFIGPVNLNGVVTHYNSKILSNKYYDEIQKDPNSKGMNIPFYKIHHSGLPEIILDCEITAYLFGEKDDIENTLSPYIIKSHISVLEKNTELFIPIAKVGSNYVYPKKVTVIYSTIHKERIQYTYDVDNQLQTHNLMNKLGQKEKELYKVDIQGENWIYPAKIKQ